MKHLKVYGEHYVTMNERDFKDKIYGHDLNRQEDIDRHVELNHVSITNRELRQINKCVNLDELETSLEEMEKDGIFGVEGYGKNSKNFTPSDGIVVTKQSFTSASYVMFFCIYKLIDEYYYLDIYYLNTQIYYQCDQLDGLKKCLRDKI